MQRVFGVTAAFVGWFSLLLSAVTGLVASEFLGLNHTEGPLPPNSVYGVPEVVVLWILVGGALVAFLPVGSALASTEPSRPLYMTAAVLAVTGVVLLADEMGRVHAVTILASAGAFGAAGHLLAEPVADEAADAGAPAVDAGAGDQARAQAAPAPQAPVAATPAAATMSTAKPAAATPQTEPGAPARAAKAKPSATRSRAGRGSATLCPWCSAQCRPGARTCNSCGAALVSSSALAEEAIPGVTVVSPELRDYAYRVAHPDKKRRPSLLSMMMGDKDDRLLDPDAAPPIAGAPDAVKPPSDQLRLEMERLALEIRAAHDAALYGSGAGTPGGDAGDASSTPTA
jgi:hypothetical protein